MNGCCGLAPSVRVPDTVAPCASDCNGAEVRNDPAAAQQACNVPMSSSRCAHRSAPFAGDYKGEGDPFQPRTAAQQTRQQQLMDSLHRTFIAFVRQRRGAALQAAPAGRAQQLPQPALQQAHQRTRAAVADGRAGDAHTGLESSGDAVTSGSRAADAAAHDANELFTGRVWTGADAVHNGLIDGVGDMHSILTRKYGEAPRLKEFGKPKVPWWAVGSVSSFAMLQGIGMQASLALRQRCGQLVGLSAATEQHEHHSGRFDREPQPRPAGHGGEARAVDAAAAGAALVEGAVPALEQGLQVLEDYALWQQYSVRM